MPLTFTKYLTALPWVDKTDTIILLANVDDWQKAAAGEYIQRLPSPLRLQYVEEFNKRVNEESRFCNRIGADHFTPLQIISRFDTLANRILGAREQQLVSSFVFPASVMRHDNEYLTAGVATTIGLVDRNGALSGKWHQTTTYSGNHAKANAAPYRSGGGSSALKLIRDISENCWGMIHETKPDYTKVSFLGDDRHAEDGWMAYLYGPFVEAARALNGLDDLPDLDEHSLYEQANTRPRIEVLMSMPPCVRAHGDNRSGCREYFRRMRRDTHENIPIVLYTYRPFEAAQGKKQLYYISKGGDLISPGNLWAR